MDVAVIKRKEILGAGRDATRLASRRQRKDAKVSLGRIMIAQRRPYHGLAQEVWIHVKHRALILSVCAGRIGIITEHEPKVGVAAAGKGTIVLPDGARLRVCSAGIANDPNPRWLGCGWRGNEIVFTTSNERVG